MPNLLKFVSKNHPILRQIIPEVEDFKDPELLEIILNMRFSILPEQLKKAGAAHQCAVGMAANQWGIERRVFIFAINGAVNDSELEVILNPSYVPYSSNQEKPKLVAAYEGCFSIPLTIGIVNRYEKIIATYQTIDGERKEELMEGWKARVFQHETDHLDGKLFDGKIDRHEGPDCIERIVFKDNKEKEAFWAKQVEPYRDKNK